MPKFTNFGDLEVYLQQKIFTVLNRYKEIESVLAEEMQQAIWEVVYDAYDPIYYNRREDEDGLADKRNMEITSVTVVDGKVRLIFENLTQGNDNQRDQYIGELIEFGEGHRGMTWMNPDGVWSLPRPFAEETAKRLNENPANLIEALRNGLRAKGLIVS